MRLGSGFGSKARWMASALLIAAVGIASLVRAQTPDRAPTPKPTPAASAGRPLPLGAAEVIGRYQIQRVEQGNGAAVIIRIDTATGQCWSAAVYGSTTQSWREIK